jgi:hypothetical protein
MYLDRILAVGGRLRDRSARPCGKVRELLPAVLTSLLVGLAGVFLAGCANEVPFAATQSLRLTPEERSTKLVLDEADQAEVTRAMSEVAEGHRTAGRITRQPGGRFSDVPEAVDRACTEVEMAVVRAHEEPDGWRFELKTITGLPGELRVTRVDGAEVYEATASIGRDHPKPDRAEALLGELRRQIQLLGRRQRYSAP